MTWTGDGDLHTAFAAALDLPAATLVADVFARRAAYAALLGHPMLMLLDCTADLGELGGGRAAVVPVPAPG